MIPELINISENKVLRNVHFLVIKMYLLLFALLLSFLENRFPNDHFLLFFTHSTPIVKGLKTEISIMTGHVQSSLMIL